MSGHTPGPLVARKVSDQEWHVDAPDGDPTLSHLKWTGLAVVYGADYFPEEGAKVAEANARLFAAAPDLLAAGEAILAASRLDPVDVRATFDAFVALEEAIKKARGES
jgi:hypothetical protein